MIEAMSEVAARAEIEALSAVDDTALAISSAQLDWCVKQAKRADKQGYMPSDAAWTPTFDTAVGVALVWKVRGAKFSGGAGNVKSESVEDMNRDYFDRAAQCKAQYDEWMAQASIISVKMITQENLVIPGSDLDWTIFGE